jgi:hypothetical protein
MAEKTYGQIFEEVAQNRVKKAWGRPSGSAAYFGTAKPGIPGPPAKNIFERFFRSFSEGTPTMTGPKAGPVTSPGTGGSPMDPTVIFKSLGGTQPTATPEQQVQIGRGLWDYARGQMGNKPTPTPMAPTPVRASDMVRPLATAAGGLGVLGGGLSLLDSQQPGGPSPANLPARLGQGLADAVMPAPVSAPAPSPVPPQAPQEPGMFQKGVNWLKDHGPLAAGVGAGGLGLAYLLQQLNSQPDEDEQLRQYEALYKTSSAGAAELLGIIRYCAQCGMSEERASASIEKIASYLPSVKEAWDEFNSRTVKRAWGSMAGPSSTSIQPFKAPTPPKIPAPKLDVPKPPAAGGNGMWDYAGKGVSAAGRALKGGWDTGVNMLRNSITSGRGATQAAVGGVGTAMGGLGSLGARASDAVLGTDLTPGADAFTRSMGDSTMAGMKDVGAVMSNPFGNPLPNGTNVSQNQNAQWNAVPDNLRGGVETASRLASGVGNAAIGGAMGAAAAPSYGAMPAGQALWSGGKAVTGMGLTGAGYQAAGNAAGAALNQDGAPPMEPAETLNPDAQGSTEPAPPAMPNNPGEQGGGPMPEAGAPQPGQPQPGQPQPGAPQPPMAPQDQARDVLRRVESGEIAPEQAAQEVETTLQGLLPEYAQKTGEAPDQIWQRWSQGGFTTDDIETAFQGLAADGRVEASPQGFMGFLEGFKQLDTWEQAALVIGLPVGLMGIASMLGGEGGLMGALMSALGLGAAGAVAYGNNMGGIQDLIGGFMGGQQGPAPAPTLSPMPGAAAGGAVGGAPGAGAAVGGAPGAGAAAGSAVGGGAPGAGAGAGAGAGVQSPGAVAGGAVGGAAPGAPAPATPPAPNPAAPPAPDPAAQPAGSLGGFLQDQMISGSEMSQIMKSPQMRMQMLQMPDQQLAQIVRNSAAGDQNLAKQIQSAKYTPAILGVPYVQRMYGLTEQEATKFYNVLQLA